MIQTISLRLNLKVVSDFIEIKKQPPPLQYELTTLSKFQHLYSSLKKKSISKQVIKRKEYKT